MAIVLLTIAGTALQLFGLGRKLSFVCLLPTFRGRQFGRCLTFGSFTLDTDSWKHCFFTIR